MAKRQTIGQRISAARLELGLSVPQLVRKISDDHRFDVGASTVRDIEADRTPNPGIKTLEFIAIGVGLAPLETIGLGLDAPPESEPGFRETQFARLANSYKKVKKEKRPFADELVRIVIEQIDRYR